METIATTVVATYATTYLTKYAFEYITYNIFKKTTNEAKNMVKRIIWKKKPKPIDYQLIKLDENGEIVNDEIIYVSSKERKKKIDSLDNLEILNTHTTKNNTTTNTTKNNTTKKNRKKHRKHALSN